MQNQLKQNKKKIRSKTKRNEISNDRLTFSQRSELSTHIACLLKIGFAPSSNLKEEWEQFIAMQSLLSKIMELESPLQCVRQNNPDQRLSNIEAFLKWSKDNGISAQGVDITEFAGYELGLQASRDVLRNEQLFIVPRKVILTENELDEGLFFKDFDTMANVKLAYTIIVEFLKPDSFWKPYIDLLPQTYNTVLYYSIQNMEELRGSNALSKALRQCKSIARQYALIYNCLNTQGLSKKTPVADLVIKNFSYELYRWAVSTVMTRQNVIPSIEQRISNENEENTSCKKLCALIPFWDMANHCQGKITSYYNLEKQQMECEAMMDFKKNQQIFISYGDRSNEDMLIHNGFVDPNKQNDYTSIRLGISLSDPLHEKRLELLKLLNITRFTEFKILSEPDYITPELLAFARVFNMSIDQLNYWISVERAMDLLQMDCVLEGALETKTWLFLETRISLLLRGFSTILQKDELLLNNEHVISKSVIANEINDMILQYRILEKRILETALNYIRQKIKS